MFSKYFFFRLYLFVACPDGNYGENCNEQCGNCNNTKQCHHVNGTCLNGCKTGFQSDKCIESRYNVSIFKLSESLW